MSQRNKLSLWQKIKRLLTAFTPQSVVDATSTPAHSLSTKSAPEETASDSQSSANTDTHHHKKHAQAQATHLSIDAHTHSSTPIIDCLKQYFNGKQWHYTHYPPKTNDRPQSHHLSLRVHHKQLNCGYLFRAQEKTKLLAVYGILPFLIPESHQNAAMLLITQLNYDMLIGNLEMDVNDGEIRYKNAIDVEAVGLNHDTIEHLLQSVIAMTTIANELFGDLVNHQDPAEDIQTLLIELRQHADARTFFLPTQFVQ